LCAFTGSSDYILVAQFVECIVTSIQTLHSQDRQPPEPKPIKGTYNPPSGTAYYFTETGEQLRQQPHYDIEQDSKNFDTRPEGKKTCTKDFPEVSYGGFGYLNTALCPLHGHFYGLHLITGGEGRKDPFSALFKYATKAPEEVFYDFACSLSEYSLNREPAFFMNTRFWHDFFHAIGHICGAVYKSARVLGLRGLNTEICEQFNAYLQCIKYTGSHLRQENFMFLFQFMGYLWNIEKTARQKTVGHVVIAGSM
jgi:hypothetical protein